MKAIRLMLVVVLCLMTWPALAEEAQKPRLRKVSATGKRDVITLKHGARFTGVILRERKKAIDFLAVASSGRIYRAEMPLAQIKKIERLTAKARKVVRAKIEAAQKKQRKADRKKLVQSQSPPATTGYFAGTWSNPYCQSFRHVAFNPYDGGLGPDHYLTPAGLAYVISQAPWWE